MWPHLGDKPYRCYQCLKCFSYSSHLKVQMRTHSGVKPYRCDQCTKCFGQRSNLKSYMITHSGEKPGGATPASAIHSKRQWGAFTQGNGTLWLTPLSCIRWNDCCWFFACLAFLTLPLFSILILKWLFNFLFYPFLCICFLLLIYYFTLPCVWKVLYK